MSVLMPQLPSAVALDEVVLFGFDNVAWPFTAGVQRHLIPASEPQIVLRPGEMGAHDEVLQYYGTVLRIDDRFHMWYSGNYGPLDNYAGFERKHCHICYATSRDGVSWEKPDLGLVEFNGSRKNNIVEFPHSNLWSTCAVIRDPEDSDPARLYKLAYEAKYPSKQRPGKFILRTCVAFSPDGLRWTASPRNPVGPFLEMAGLTKFRGLYYLNGQGQGQRPVSARRLMTLVSADFETWSPAPCVGMERSNDLHGPSREDGAAQPEEIHLGAAMWNRGNVILGIYGQWHGHFSGDRRFVVMDLGLAITHDAMHYHEPIPGFRIVPARETPESPNGFGPALMQGQGMENVGDQTLYWYSSWRGVAGSGVRLVTWIRDRLGAIKPFTHYTPLTVSSIIRSSDGSGSTFCNASGLGEHSRLRISVLDEGFQPVAGYSKDDAAIIDGDDLRAPVIWKSGDRLPADKGVRLEVRFEGIRPEDCRLHAIYVGN